MLRPILIALVFTDGCGLFNLAAAQVAFTRVAGSTEADLDPFNLGSPSINDAGQVSFNAQSSDGSLTRILRGTAAGGPLVTIASDSADVASLGDATSINAAGQIAFYATLDRVGPNPEALLRGDGTATPAVIVDTTGPFNFLTVVPSLNDAGAVAFQAEQDGPSFAEGLFVGSGGPVATVFDTDGPAFDDSFAAPSINGVGQIAFRARTDAGNEGIFRFDPGTNTFATIADDAGDLAFFDDEPSLNAAGRVAFEAALDAGTGGEEAILIGDGSGPAVTVADTLDAATGLAGFNGQSLNDLGQVAYLASLDAGGDAIFLDGTRLIGTGDALDGSTVAFLGLFREGLNNLGQVAFLAGLDDGRAGIYVAAVVPEPATALAACAATSLHLRRRRRGDRR